MKDIVTPVPPEEVKGVIRKCLEQAAQLNYERIKEYAKIEGKRTAHASLSNANDANDVPVRLVYFPQWLCEKNCFPHKTSCLYLTLFPSKIHEDFHLFPLGGLTWYMVYSHYAISYPKWFL